MRLARLLALACALAPLACGGTPASPAAFQAAPRREQTLDNGVKIEVIAEGRGPEAVAADRVEIHYTLYLEDGTLIDDSHDGKPTSFLILEDDSLIEGLQHGMLGMRAGELRRVWVPARLGYADRRVGAIPPRARLRFDVELMDLHPNPYD